MIRLLPVKRTIRMLPVNRTINLSIKRTIRLLPVKRTIRLLLVRRTVRLLYTNNFLSMRTMRLLNAANVNVYYFIFDVQKNNLTIRLLMKMLTVELIHLK